MKGEMKRKIRLSNLQVVAIGYFLVALLGTALLLLPVSSQEGETTLLQAVFTSVSASCVTGLVLVDTGMHWSLFGQIVILLLIQIGGMGFMTIGIQLMMLFRKKIGLKEREVLVESINVNRLGGVLGLAKRIVKRTFIIELAGAVLLAIRFIPEFGPAKGAFYSIFHSVSAFCNAGFDLMGIRSPYSSFAAYSGDALVSFTLMALITVGGIGVLVWDDIYTNGLKWRRYSLHTKIVLSISAMLSLGGGLLFFILERNATGADMGLAERAITALFQSVTCRTAGFNTVDTAALSQGSKLLSMMLMFVGGSPGSTAGGIKTTTLAVMLLYMLASIKKDDNAVIFGRGLEETALHRAVSIFTINLGIVIAGSLLICALQPLQATDVVFETFSAMGTAGMSAGITRMLTTPSAVIIVLLMFFGRVGSVSLAGAFLEKRAKPPVTVPTEKIRIG